MSAILGLDAGEIRASPYTGKFEDLFFHVEHLIYESAGEAAGNLHLARSRNDLGVAMYRMALRDRLLRVEWACCSSCSAPYSRCAEEHVGTVMPAHTHAQRHSRPRSPTTSSRFEILSRDLRRLGAAFENCNRSPSGPLP